MDNVQKVCHINLRINVWHSELTRPRATAEARASGLALRILSALTALRPQVITKTKIHLNMLNHFDAVWPARVASSSARVAAELLTFQLFSVSSCKIESDIHSHRSVFS